MQKEFSKIVKLEREISAENFLKINVVDLQGVKQKINLIDEIGVEDDAIEWLKKGSS